MNKRTKNNVCIFSVIWLVLLCHMLVLKGTESKSRQTKQEIEHFLSVSAR